jgi:hypothetical protein
MSKKIKTIQPRDVEQILTRKEERGKISVLVGKDVLEIPYQYITYADSNFFEEDDELNFNFDEPKIEEVLKDNGLGLNDLDDKLQEAFNGYAYNDKTK